MSDDNKTTQASSLVAAAIILLVAGVALYFLPNIVMWVARYSPNLAVAVGAAIIAAFFLVFWIRSRFQKR
jgi:hypothetical protein